MTSPRKAFETTPHHSTALSHFTEPGVFSFTHLSLSLQWRLHDGRDFVYSSHSGYTKLIEYNAQDRLRIQQIVVN